MSKMLKRWLESIGTIIFGAAILKCYPLFLSGYQRLQQLGLLTLALLAIDILLFLTVIAFDILSLVKSYREKHKFIKKRFGILWKYEQINATGNPEPVPYCLKHRSPLIESFITQNTYHWHCNECKEIVLPTENGRVINCFEAVTRMRKWFNRI